MRKLKKAKSGYLAAYYNYAQTLRSAFADVDNSLTKQQKMNAIYQNQVKGLPKLRKNPCLSHARYQQAPKTIGMSSKPNDSRFSKLDVNLAKNAAVESVVEVVYKLWVWKLCRPLRR